MDFTAIKIHKVMNGYVVIMPEMLNSKPYPEFREMAKAMKEELVGESEIDKLMRENEQGHAALQPVNIPVLPWHIFKTLKEALAFVQYHLDDNQQPQPYTMSA